MKSTIIDAVYPVYALESTKGDMVRFDTVVAARILYIMKLINRFENTLLELQGKQILWGALHTSIGVEGPAAAAMQSPRDKK